jgi:hypothetical protein
MQLYDLFFNTTNIYYFESYYYFFSVFLLFFDLNLWFFSISLILIDLNFKFILSEFLWITLFFNRKHFYATKLKNLPYFETVVSFITDFEFNIISSTHNFNLEYIEVEDGRFIYEGDI